MFKPLAHAIAPCDVYLGVSWMPCEALMTHDAHLPPFASVGYRSCRYSMQIDQAPCPSLLGFVAWQLGNNASCWDQIDGTPHFLSTLTVTVRFDVAWPKLSCGPSTVLPRVQIFHIMCVRFSECTDEVCASWSRSRGLRSCRLAVPCLCSLP